MNKKLLTLLVIIGLGSFSSLYAQKSFSGSSGGNWNTASNWTPSGVPASTDDVTIPNNKNVTVDIAAVCKTFTISGGNNSNTISVGANSLTVTGAVTIGALTAGANKTKTISISTGLLSCASIAIANNPLPTQMSSITVTSTGTIRVTGNFAMSGNSTYNKLNIDNGGTLEIGGTLSGGGFSSTNSNSIVNFNGTAAQTIPINTYTFNKIIIGNTHTSGATLGAAITALNVTDNITVQTGILNNGGFAIAGNPAKIFTVANGATFKASGTTSAFPSGFGTNTLAANSIVEYSGSGNQAIFDVASPGYGHLTLSTGGTKTAAEGLDIQGNVTVNSGPTFAASTFTHNVKGSWSNAGTFTAGTSTINFNGTATGKTISGTLSGTSKFYNLTFNGVGGGWTIGSSLTVNNMFAITNGAVSVSSGVLTLEANTAFPTLGGTLTLENSASLIQSGYTGLNTGNINVNRNTSTIVLDDYTYWSSPTNGSQTLGSFSPATQLDKFFKFDNSGWIYADTSSTFTSGVGYALRSPDGISPTVAVAVAHQFTGKPNNGDLNVPVTLSASGNSYKLIGNPYPSAIDANAFISANLSTITGTLYFWTHNHGLTQDNGSNYDSDDYAKYTTLGGTRVGGAGTGNNTLPTQYIASGQGFFVETIAAGNITFNNTMRTSGATDNSNFYKSSNGKNASVDLEVHRIWLNLTNNTSTNFSQALVGYMETATNGYDTGIDGLCFGANQFVLYSLIGDEQYAIQGRALPFTDTDLVQFGYKINVVGDATISIDQIDGLFLAGQNIYLEDKLLNVTHNLKLSPYTFASEAGTFNDRFVLKYVNSALGLENFNLSDSLTVASKEKVIIVKSELEQIEQVTVYDMLGRQIYENKKVNSNEVLISNLMGNQAIIIKTVLATGQVINKKLVF